MKDLTHLLDKRMHQTEYNGDILNISEYLEKQRAAIIDEFVNAMSTCLVATTRNRLIRHSKQYGWSIFALPGTDFKSVIVLKKSENSLPELWVKWSYRRHRNAFLMLLQHFHHYTCTTIPTTLQVDHLQAKHRFKKGHPDYYIRLFLMQREVNASYGAGHEKSLHRMERQKVPLGGFHMDWMTFLKAYGITPPSKGASPEVWKAWAREQADTLKNQGIDTFGDAYFGILIVLQLGFTGYYSGSETGEALEFLFDAQTKSRPRPTRVATRQFQYELEVGDAFTVNAFYKTEGETGKHPLPQRRDLDFNYDGDFQMGYAGRGPTFLAKSILAHHFGHDDFGITEENQLVDNVLSILRTDMGARSYFLTTELLEGVVGAK